MIIGPFHSLDEEGGKRKLRMKVLRPAGFGKYEEDELTIYLGSDDKVEKKNNMYYVETSNPWLQTIGLDSKLILPRVSGNVVENVVPVATIEKTDTTHRFYGYYVVFRDGKPVDVRGAGIYERIVPPELKDKEPAIPARLVKDITELGKDEFIELARYTPPELLSVLHRAGRRDIVATNVAETIRSNPLALKNYPREIVEKYLLDEQDLIVKMALLENTPMMMKVLISELQSMGYDTTKLSYLWMRYREEVEEDKQLERVKEEGRKRMEEQRRREMEEHEKQLAREYGNLIKQIIGVSIPLVVSSLVVPELLGKTVMLKEKKVEEKRVEAEEVQAS